MTELEAEVTEWPARAGLDMSANYWRSETPTRPSALLPLYTLVVGRSERALNPGRGYDQTAS